MDVDAGQRPATQTPGALFVSPHTLPIGSTIPDAVPMGGAAGQDPAAAAHLTAGYACEECKAP
eukprot:4973718-Prorocentrum_lima.AAC.1